MNYIFVPIEEDKEKERYKFVPLESFAQPEPITGMESAFATAPIESKPKPAKQSPTRIAPTPYKSRAEAVDDIVNLAEEGVPLEQLRSQSERLGLNWDEVTGRGQSRGSPMFQTGAMEPISPEQQASLSGRMKEVEPTAAQEVLNVGRRGLAQLERERILQRFQTGQISETEAAERLRLNERKTGAARASGDIQAGLERLNELNEAGDTLGVAKALIDPSNTKAVLALVAESIIPSMANLPATIAGGVLGGPGGAASATFITSFASEYANSLGEALENAGVSASDPFAVSKALQDPQILEDARLRGMNRGIPVAAFDALTAGVGGKFVNSYLRALKTAGQQATRKGLGIASAKEAGVQIGGGMAGEAVAQAATDEYKPLDIFIEGVAELPGGIAEVATNVGRAQPSEVSRLLPKGEPDVTISPDRRPSPTIGGEGVPISGRRERTLAPEGTAGVEPPAVGEPPPTSVVTQRGTQAPSGPLEIDRASLVPIIDELEQYDPELAKYAREVINDRSQRITQDDVDILTAQLNDAKAKGTPSAPTPPKTIQTEEEGSTAPAEGAEVATAAKPDPNAPFNEFEQQEYDLAQRLLQTPGGKSFGEGVLSRLQGPMRFTKPSTQQSVDFIAEKLKQYETPSQAESPSVTNTLRDTLRDNTQRERLILQQYEKEMQREDAPANQILSQTNGVLARINDAIRQAGFMPYDGASIRTSAPSNIQALYKLASMVNAGGYSILSQRLAQDKKYQAFSADKLKILFDRQNRDLAAANEALDKLAAPKEAAERTSEQILNEQKEVLVERNKLRTSRNRPPSGKSPARVKWDELTSKFDELTQELAEVSKKEKAAKPAATRTLEQVTKEKQDLTAQRDALLTSKGKVPAVRSPSRRKYDRLTEQINALSAEALALKPKKPVETGVKDEVDIAREKRIAFLEGELDRANSEIEQVKSEPSGSFSDQQRYEQKQRLDALEERKAKLQDSLDKARVPRTNIGGDFFDVAEAFVGPPLPEGYQPVQVAGIGVITDALNKNPSLRRAVAKYFKQYEAGEITAEEYAREVNRVYEETKQDKEPADLVRGQLNFRERLLRAERAGELPPGTLAFTEWFISLNPSLLNDVAISIRGPRGERDEGVAGQYLPLPRIVRLLAGNLKRTTAVHELLHHFERMLPESLQSAIREMWIKSLVDKLRRSPYGSPQRTYLAFVHNHLLGKGSAVDLAAALSMIQNGQVPVSYYQYINPSEFWAVNATEIMQGRFGGTTSVINQIKQWLKELVAKIKDYFGLPSNAPLIRALDSLAKADGKYQSKSLLAKDVSGYYSFAGPKSIEYDPYDPQEIADDNARKEGNLKQAKDLETNGASPIEIWNKTGWWHDTIDGQWRYEINDSKAVFKADLWANLPETRSSSTVNDTPEDQRTTIGEILDHPELYRAYPELKNVVFFKRKAFLDLFQSTQGYFSPRDGTITVTPYAKDPFATLIHEIQHWIQHKEGFGPGGNAEAMQIANNVDILELLKKRYEYLIDKARQGAPGRSEKFYLKKIATVQEAIDNQFELSKAAAKRDRLGQKKTNLQKELNTIPEKIALAKEELENAITLAVEGIQKEIDALKNPATEEDIKKLNELYDERRSISYAVSKVTGRLYDHVPPPKNANVLAVSNKFAKLTEREEEIKKEIDQVEDELKVAKKNYADLEGNLGSGPGRVPISTIKYDLYQMVSGEIESRNTENRLTMTAEEREQTPPSATADIDAAFAFLNSLDAEAAQAAPPGGPRQRRPRVRGPISGRSKWRTVEEVTRKLSDVLDDALKGRMTWGRVAPQITKTVWESSNAALRKALLFAATLRQMADLTRYKFPQLLTAINIVDKMTSYRLKKLNEAQSIALDWQKAQNNKPSQSKLLGKIMLDATINGKDPDRGATTPELDAAWASLDPEFKEIYRKVRDYFNNNLKEMIRDMKMRVIKLPKAERQEAIRKINEQFGPDKLIAPYFPLRRFGEYWFQVGKGNFKEFYEFESSFTRNLSRDARIRELQAGNANQRALAETVDFGDGISELFSKNLASTQILKDVQELIDSIVPPTGVSTKSAQEVRKELQDSLNQLIYIMLPQQSMRKMFINRNAVQGASGDMLRVFTDVAVHSAYQAARFKYSEDFINNINKARDYVKEFYAPNTRAKYMDFINELEKRTKTILSAEDKSLLAKAAGTSGTIVFFTMLSSPFTALLNTLGFAVFTGSKLGGKYGYTEASEVMLKNMGRYWLTAPSRTLKPVANAMTQFKPGMVLDMQFPSIVEGGQLSPLMQRAADRFIEEGQINVSLTNDIFDLSDRPSELYTTRYEIIKKILGGLFHQSERANREVALMSAFELEYNKLLSEPKRSTSGFIMRDANGDPITYTPDEAFEAAIEEAKNIAGLTLGDFSRQMKSRLFANVPLSVILKFKQYAVMATYNYIRAAQMFAVPYTKKEIEEIKRLFQSQSLSQPEIDRRIEEIVAFKKDIGKQSGKELAGILGVTFLFGGMEAMPFFWIAMPIMAAMLASDDDDDDDLFDYVNWFRNWASSWLGGMSFARGPVSELLGGSISERVSLDPVNMFYRDGRYSPDVVEGLIQDVIANAGPVVGMGINWAEAVKLFNEGQYSRAMEKVMPALFAKPLQAYRYGTEGATTRSGEVQMAPEDFSGWMLAMQAIGLQPEQLALRQKAAIQGKEVEAKILSKEKALLDRLWLERENDKGFDAALDKATEFYERYPELLPADGSFADKVMKSFDTRAEQIAEAEAIGARIDKRLQERISPMLEYGQLPVKEPEAPKYKFVPIQ